MNERTKLEYPSQPIGGGTWHEYFQKRTQDRKDLVATLDGSDDSAESYGEVTVTSPAREIDGGWPNALGSYAKLALANGWRIKMGHSSARHDAILYVDKLKGIKTAAHAETQWWMNATRDGVYVTVSYNEKNDKATCTRRFVRGDMTQLSDKEMKELIKSDNSTGD